MDTPRYGRGNLAVVAAARSIASLTAPLIGSSERLALFKLSIGRPHNTRAKTEPGAKQHGVVHASHTDQHPAVTGLFADGSVRTDELRLAVRAAQELSPRHDVLVKPAR